EQKFNENLVREYLKHGSVDEVLRVNHYSFPISYAGYQRVLDRWGIIKAAGPNSRLNEALEFLTHLAEEKIPFETLYRKMPPSFRTSTATLYRILSLIKEGITRRVGTGLVFSHYRDDKKILIGEDISTPRIELGKPYGSLSIPSGFSRKRDPREMAILRVLQQEVFENFAVEKNMPDIIPVRPKPFMFLDVADVRIEIFHIKLPKKYSVPKHFSSYKLRNFQFIRVDKIISGSMAKQNYRVGARATALGYQKYLELKGRKIVTNPLVYKSELNYQLADNYVKAN
ncbi:hypothetical protein KKB40_01015, partial [Patescibacteria group bacterium]|nr:hypothetical protein [Patescibacteria group bacterium]